MAIARAIPATPIGVAFLLSFPLLIAAAPPARAHAPAVIEYAGEGPASAPVQMASLEPVHAPVQYAQATVRRGPLTAYGYGAQAAPASGPTIDLRGAFSDAPATTSRRPDFTAAPVVAATPATALTPVASTGPLDIRPPETDAAPQAVAVSEPADVAVAPSPAAGAYLVQVGAFAQKANADRTRARTATLGAVLVDTIERPSGPLYRVRLGPWQTRQAADAARASLVDLGYADAKVTQAD